MLPASEVRIDAAEAGAVPFLAEGAAFALPVAERPASIPA